MCCYIKPAAEADVSDKPVGLQLSGNIYKDVLQLHQPSEQTFFPLGLIHVIGPDHAAAPTYRDRYFRKANLVANGVIC